MYFLLSNDDGYQAKGLQSLYAALAKSHALTVVAPEHNKSGCSHALTLDKPVHVRTAENGFIYVSGTPADCVHLAITNLLKKTPDMVLSGINAGANLGDDVLYSGTVAAAMEARFLGCPALAISLAGRNTIHYETAAQVTLKIIELLPMSSLKTAPILNINVPDIPFEEIGRFEVTRLGNRHQSEPSIKSKDIHDNTVYSIGIAGKSKDNEAGTDFHAVNNNNVSITPLHVDLTQYNMVADPTSWITLEKLNE